MAEVTPEKTSEHQPEKTKINIGNKSGGEDHCQRTTEETEEQTE
jgi:hypothetical protein